MHTRPRIFLSLALMAFVSCNGDDDDSSGGATVSPDDAVARIAQALNDFNVCLADVRDAKGPQSVFRFLDLREGESLSEQWVEDLVESLSTALVLDEISDDKRYAFDSHTGTYSWSSAQQDWTHAATPANAIVALFPSRESGLTNNASVTFSNYSDTTVTTDDEELGMPTTLAIECKVDGDVVLGFEANMSYEPSSDPPIPIQADLALDIPPYSLALSADRLTRTRFAGELTFAGPDDCSVTLEAEVRLLSDDYEALEDEDVDGVDVKLTVGDVSLVISVDVDALVRIDRPTAAQYNAYVAADIYHRETSKMAELVVGMVDADGEIDGVNIVYSDGSKQPIEDITDPFLEQLETDYSAYLGDW